MIMASRGETNLFDQEVAAMQQQVQRPVRRAETQRTPNADQEVWPQSARQFMKLPVSGLLSAGKRLTFTRLSAPPDQAA